MRFDSLFTRLFGVVMLALIVFAVAILLLAQAVHSATPASRARAMASHIMVQIEPFLQDLSAVDEDRVQMRFSLAVIKKSFDIFSDSLNADLGLYDKNGKLVLNTEGAELPNPITSEPWYRPTVLALIGQADNHVRLYSSGTGYTLWYQGKSTGRSAKSWLNLFSGTLILLVIMAVVLGIWSKLMTRRLDNLHEQIKALAAGDFDARAMVKGDDEIAELARGFNHAAQKIQSLIRANQLLLAHASHEFRTPITRMRLQTEMLAFIKTDDPTKQKISARTHAINKDLNNLNELVEGVLMASRLGAGFAQEPLQKTDLLTLAQSECEHYPQVELIGNSISVWVQPKLVTHVIQNLINNAINHGKAPITVQVYGAFSLGEKPSTPTLFSRLKKTMPKVCFGVIAVLDGGCGIPKEKREAIFSPFMRLSQNKKGSGLGLSLVAQIARDHGGYAWCDTLDGQTRFLFAVPCEPAKNHAKMPTN